MESLTPRNLPQLDDVFAASDHVASCLPWVTWLEIERGSCSFHGPFKDSPENRDYLIGLHRRFFEYPLVIEVPHSSWINDETLDLLAELAIGIWNIDQPLFHRSVTPAAHVTSKIGHIRLHGRNYKQWFSRTQMCGNATAIYIRWMNWNRGSIEQNRSRPRRRIRMLRVTTTTSAKRLLTP